MLLQAGCLHGMIDRFRDQCVPCAHGEVADGYWVVEAAEPYMTTPEVWVVWMLGGLAFVTGQEEPVRAGLIKKFVRRLEIPEAEDQTVADKEAP